MVMWLIGLSGAGKTTLAQEIVAHVRHTKANVALVDGDTIRDVFGNDLGHTLEDRRTNAARICRMCHWLDKQGVHVVCAILSVFEESRQWNREHIGDYVEVFIDTPMDDLMARDSKGVYSRYQEGVIENVAGLDLDFPRPQNSDVVIVNTGSRDELLAHAGPLAERVRKAAP